MTRLNDIEQHGVPFLPLAHVILFPHMELQVRIFEPRYLRLVADVLRGNQYLAVAVFRPGWEEDYFAEPAVQPIAGVGYLQNVKITEDRELMITVKGLARVRIIKESLRNSYRVGQVQLLFDKEQFASSRGARAGSDQLWFLYAKFLEYLPDQGRKLANKINQKLPLGALCDLIAAHLLHDLRIKQKLFNIVNPLERANFLINVLQEYLETAHYLRAGRKQTPKRPWLN